MEVTNSRKNQNANDGWRRLRLSYCLLGLLFGGSSAAIAQPLASTDTPAEGVATQPTASRAMLEFLMEFSELDDTEFELLTAYAEKDADQEPEDSNNE